MVLIYLPVRHLEKLPLPNGLGGVWSAKTQCVGMLSLSERAKGPSRDPSARRTIKDFRRGKVLSTGRICLSLDPTRQSAGKSQVLFCILNAVLQRGAHGRQQVGETLIDTQGLRPTLQGLG